MHTIWFAQFLLLHLNTWACVDVCGTTVQHGVVKLTLPPGHDTARRVHGMNDDVNALHIGCTKQEARASSSGFLVPAVCAISLIMLSLNTSHKPQDLAVLSPSVLLLLLLLLGSRSLVSAKVMHH